MTTPTVVRRTLTFDFSPTIEYSGAAPASMEVALLALVDATNPAVGQGFVSPDPQVQTVVLSQEHNIVTYSLVPSASPGLNTQINYRVMWRQGVTGRTFSYDFAMPDQDINFADLASLGSIITGEVYLKNSDLGVPGRVARLNSGGHVVDSTGTPVATAADIATVTTALTAETTARESDISSLDSTLSAALSSAQSTLASSITSGLAGLHTTITNETNSAVATEAARAAGAESTLHTSITALSSELSAKADLVSGKVPLSELPVTALTTNGLTAANQGAMLGLTSTQVATGDIVVRPDGTFLLVGSDPSVLSDWLPLSQVTSVNGQQGAVEITAASLGALATSGTITMAQVTNLNAALEALAAGIGDTTLVHTTGGLIPKALTPSDSVFVDPGGMLVKKDGTIIAVAGTGGGGGSPSDILASVDGGLAATTVSSTTPTPVDGGSPFSPSVGSPDYVSGGTPLSTVQVEITSVNGQFGPTITLGAADVGAPSLTAYNAALAAKADLVAGTVPLAEIPTIPQTQVGSLTSTLSALSTTITELVTTVTDLENTTSPLVVNGGDAGGGSSSVTLPGVTTWVGWHTPVLNIAATPAGLLSSVVMSSPFGVDTTGGVTGIPGYAYINPAGAQPNDVVYPYITPNGHLQLRRWNESNPPDPALATEAEIATINTTLATKANESDLVALQSYVASAPLVSAVSTRVSTLESEITTKADLVSGKVPVSELPNLDPSQINGLTTTLAAKADLVSGVVPVAQLPTNIAQSQITGLPAALAAKADLVSGTVPLSELPAIPQSGVTGLATTLSHKADLDPTTGQLVSSQIPAITLMNPKVVSSLSDSSLATQVVGTVAIVTGGTQMGTYILTSLPGSTPSNWTQLTAPTAAVSSINGQTGVVTLAPSSIGAMPATPADGSIAQSKVAGLVTALASTLSTSTITPYLTPVSVSSITAMTSLSSTFVGMQVYVTKGPGQGSYVLTATNPTVLANWWQLPPNSGAVAVKRTADFVTPPGTGNVTRTGSQSIDGVVVPVGKTVLLTTQSSSVDNGLWVVNTGAWTRPADYATGQYISRSTLILVGPGTTTNPTRNTFWQCTSASASPVSNDSGIIDTDPTTWQLVMTGGGPVNYTAGNGLALSGTSFAVQGSTGIIASGSGVAVDPSLVPYKFSKTLPSTAMVQTINATEAGVSTFGDVASVTIRDTGTGNIVLAGVTVNSGGASISIEFGTAPSSGQYRVTILF